MRPGGRKKTSNDRAAALGSETVTRKSAEDAPTSNTRVAPRTPDSSRRWSSVLAGGPSLRQEPRRSALLQIGDDPSGGVGARAAGDPTAGMSPRARQVQAIEREPVSGVAVQRPPREELIEPRLGVLNVAPGEAVLGFEVVGGDDVARLYELAEPGRVPLQRLHGDVAEPVAFGRPIALTQQPRGRLEQHAHHVLAFGC